jgi:protein-S-isoprenylcysteine O-methyltransferase Ste14
MPNHEEQVLAAAFGEQWADYCRRVPAWLPRFMRKQRVV